MREVYARGAGREEGHRAGEMWGRCRGDISEICGRYMPEAPSARKAIVQVTTATEESAA